MKKKLAIFDFDGTLFRGNISLAFLKYAVQKRLINQEFEEKVDKIVAQYAQKEISYEECASQIINLIAEFPQEVTSSNITKLGEELIRSQKDFWYNYSFDLIKIFLKNNFEVVLISGSSLELLKSVKNIFGNIRLFGTEFEVVNDHFTGKVILNLALNRSKEKILKEILKENIDLKNSFGFGNAEPDLSFLQKVGYPVALNPNDVLEKIARQNNWPIFTEKDDVVREVQKML